MSSIRLGAASSVQAFQKLGSALASSDGKWTNLIDGEALDDELGRFRVWSGNLGALQKGHSSLDYRLRDSPLLSSNALKLLQELQDNLGHALDIVSGARLPYEEQLKSEKSVDVDKDEDDEDDDFFSEDEDNDSEPGSSKTELKMRFSEIVDIIDNLYKLSVRIRTPTIRSRSLKAASYQPKDPETGVDILEQYATFDHQHTCDLVRDLRRPHVGEAQEESTDFISRLSRGITLRRRQFKYWKRHRDKLGVSTLLEEESYIQEPVPFVPSGSQRHDTVEAQPVTRAIKPFKESPSQKTGKTMLSGTEATLHHQTLDDIVDKQSVTSYAVTVRDLSGKGIDLPPPPKAANGERDFECPYCFTICPSRYGKGRAWKTHLLQDLQPYVCTYPDCLSHEQLFRSRREWSEHEATHRKAWRCPEHPTAVYKSPTGLEEHLRRNHSDNFPESQLESIVKVGETSTVDVRDKCPICYAPADMEGMGGLQNHIANHLERIAAFALPTGTDDDSGGGSSIASRGQTGASGSQDLSAVTFDSATTEEEEDLRLIGSGSREEETGSKEQEPSAAAVEQGSSQAPLSAESLHNLPDITQSRLESLFSSQMTELGDFEEIDFDGTPVEVEEHMKKLEEFRSYLLSLPGAQSVRFFRRYGQWKGYLYFEDEVAAGKALGLFDSSMFPDVILRPIAKIKAALKFIYSSPRLGDRPAPSRQTTGDDITSISSISVAEEDQDEHDKPPILDTSNIPTLRSLYRTRKLLQRDQSHMSKDAYNQLISLCSYDLTRLKVDAIINSANRSMRVTKSAETLNWRVHTAAGPELKKQCSAEAKGKIKPGQAIITSGFNLPSKHVIHVSRPTYTGSKGVGGLNILTECYRSALNIALDKKLKTVAFPCLGAGGCGFPPRLAARIALQEVREFLDSHTNHTFERIIFCVYSTIDEKAYMDFLPVFFPPTHGDLENAVSSAPITNRSVLGWEVLEVHGQASAVYVELTKYSDNMQNFPSTVLNTLEATCSALGRIKDLLFGGLNPIQNLKEPALSDIHIICSVMQTVCGSITEITELAKTYQSRGHSSHAEVWNDYNFHMKSSHGSDMATILWICQKFAQALDDILSRDAVEPPNMVSMRTTLREFKRKQTGNDEQTIQEHFDEVMYTREFQRTTNAPARTNAVKLHQIPSISRLYQLGELEERSTFAIPSAHFNYMIYLAREDITNIEADIIVNSTDYTFGGMGTLDRMIFRKGGPEMEEECKQFVNCETGSVKLTPGYRLLAKHVLHMVPPESWRHNTKSILRKMYQEIFHTASSLRASSIAIPSIGTGMLSYPRRDSAALALEEAKRFLETAEPTNSIEKIIFVVYSSSDEFTYKALIPLYFPPVESNVNKALPMTTQQNESIVSTMSSEASSPPPRRTLFGSIGDAFRSVRFGKQPVTQTSRAPHSGEETALINFESHARDCIICNNINKLYLEGKDLCEDGYPLAQLLLQYMNMERDQSVYSKPARDGQRARIEIPSIFPISYSLLATVEKSFRDRGRTRPFVSPNTPYSATMKHQQDQEGQPPPGVTIHKAEVTVPVEQEPEKLIASVYRWSTLANRFDALYPRAFDCVIHIWPGRVDVRAGVDEHQRTQDQEQVQVPLLSLELTPTVQISQTSRDELVIDNARTFPDSVIKSGGKFMFRTQSPARCNTLYQQLSAGKANNPKYKAHQSRQDTETTPERNLRIQLPSTPQHDPADPPSRLDSRQESTDTNPDPLLSGHSTPTSEPSTTLKNTLETFLSTRKPRNPSPLDNPNPPSVLPKAILAHLKSLPEGRSQTGQHEQEIASAVHKPLPEVLQALGDLKKLYLVQNTLNEATWAANEDDGHEVGRGPDLRGEGSIQTKSGGDASGNEVTRRLPQFTVEKSGEDTGEDEGDASDGETFTFEASPASQREASSAKKRSGGGLFSRWTGGTSSRMS